MLGRARAEFPLLLAVAIGIAGHFWGERIEAIGTVANIVLAVVIIAAIIGVSVRVAAHAEVLAHRVGEPYGTMMLTISAVAVEVLILAIMITHAVSPTLVRDTIYSAVMLDINGILGVAAIIGGFKHGEQAYNSDSGKTYTVMIITAMGISMVVPEFVPRANWHAYSAFTIVAMLGLYALFLRNQIGRHSYFFDYSYPRQKKAEAPELTEETGSVPVSIGLLLLGIVIIGGLTEVMSPHLNAGLSDIGAPLGLVAVAVAAISAAPEILTAMRAALANRMQAVINIALGASLSTVILTVPVMEAIALYTGQPMIMAMTPVQTTMVLVTLIVAAINLNDGETNMIEGLTHFVLFATFVMLTLLGL
ncbi:calcium:proton antiporter [Oryzicola mucosus]|uniref:Calcium:proton antiporter n=1 Tax=Oryzicola mucosus TaxID=2767425 RepID=A0A8J6PJ47_9HYPH|nr:calcium:proton antiporter [Oryzicola mucosus]MBD0415173.1 calcium:proton antiporter [Oryzicola mucosus]